MSYRISLCYDHGPAELETPHTEGGTILLGGDTRATMTVTYNYAPLFHEHLDKKQGLRWVYGKTGRCVAPRLRDAVKALQELEPAPSESDDYWEPTPRNAAHALEVMLSWSRQHPDAIWEGD